MAGRLALPVLVAVFLGGLGWASAAPTARTALGEARQAELRAKGFEQAARRSETAAGRSRAEAEALVARIESSEARITALSVLLGRIDARLANSRTRLAERQKPLLGLTAALHTIASRPPALALAQPGSVADLVRLRAVLATSLPRIRAQSAAVRSELDQSALLRSQASAALGALAAERRRLAARRIALARLEQSELRRSADLRRFAIDEEDKAIAFAEEARAIQSQAQGRDFEARIASQLSRLPAPPLRPGAIARRAGQAAPYRIPLQGRLVTGFGELSGSGIHSRGVLVRPASETLVVAPRAGRIAFAGRFRSYGEVVIIDHGGGWTTTITGLAALRVERGADLGSGDPVGRASAGSDIGVELRRDGRPRPIAGFVLWPER